MRSCAPENELASHAAGGVRAHLEGLLGAGREGGVVVGEAVQQTVHHQAPHLRGCRAPRVAGGASSGRAGTKGQRRASERELVGKARASAGRGPHLCRHLGVGLGLVVKGEGAQGGAPARAGAKGRRLDVVRDSVADRWHAKAATRRRDSRGTAQRGGWSAELTARRSPHALPMWLSSRRAKPGSSHPGAAARLAPPDHHMRRIGFPRRQLHDALHKLGRAARFTQSAASGWRMPQQTPADSAEGARERARPGDWQSLTAVRGAEQRTVRHERRAAPLPIPQLAQCASGGASLPSRDGCAGHGRHAQGSA